MSRNESERMSLTDANVPVPRSSPPSMNVLNVRVAGRRRRHVRVRRAAFGMIVVTSLSLVVALFAFRNLQANVIVSEQPSVAVSPADSTPVDLVKRSIEADVLAPEPQSSPKLRLFARVREPVPVFQVDRDTQRISVVGWVEAEQSIPIDMQYVPQQQQETFRAVLRGDADAISL